MFGAVTEITQKVTQKMWNILGVVTDKKLYIYMSQDLGPLFFYPPGGQKLHLSSSLRGYIPPPLWYTHLARHWYKPS